MRQFTKQNMFLLKIFQLIWNNTMKYFFYKTVILGVFVNETCFSSKLFHWFKISGLYHQLINITTRSYLGLPPLSPHQPGGEGGQQRPSPPGGGAGLPEGQHEEGLGEHDRLSHHVTGALQQGHQTDSCSHYRDITVFSTLIGRGPMRLSLTRA